MPPTQKTMKPLFRAQGTPFGRDPWGGSQGLKRRRTRPPEPQPEHRSPQNHQAKIRAAALAFTGTELLRFRCLFYSAWYALSTLTEIPLAPCREAASFVSFPARVRRNSLCFKASLPISQWMLVLALRGRYYGLTFPVGIIVRSKTAPPLRFRLSL